MKKTIPFLLIALIFFSCASAPEQIDKEPVEIPIDKITSPSVKDSIRSLEDALDIMEERYYPGNRDIDSREWLMDYVNYHADVDQFIVRTLFEHLKYSTWNDNEKRSYIETICGANLGGDEGFLSQLRSDYLEEIAYLQNNSLVLQDSPWMVRDFFDERSEFSYWYIIYQGRSIYEYWLDDTVMPEMLQLIPEDRITAVSYLWLKDTDNLNSMKDEVVHAGYPWNRLLFLMEMDGFIQTELSRIYPAGNDPDTRARGALF